MLPTLGGFTALFVMVSSCVHLLHWTDTPEDDSGTKRCLSVCPRSLALTVPDTGHESQECLWKEGRREVGFTLLGRGTGGVW